MSLPWLEERRRQADRRFQELGFPDGRNEAFKYTSLKGLKRVPETTETSKGHLTLPQLNRDRLSFIDGDIVDNTLTEHQNVGPLSNFLDRAEDHLGQLSGDNTHGLAALNLARFRDGLYLKGDRGRSEPLVLHVALGALHGTCSYRHLIHLEAGVKADIVMTTSGDENTVAHLNEVTEVFLEAGAQLELTWVHRGGKGLIATQELVAQQHEESELNINLFAFESGTLRHGIDVRQVGSDATVRVAGLSLPQQDEHVDYHLDLHHRAANGQSFQNFRGLVDTGGQAVVSGKVTVTESGVGSDAQQSLRGLLLGPWAEWDARPQLEIYTDDVTASHGATVGNFDPDALFFLRSRGLDEVVSRRLLAGAFAREIAEQVNDPMLADLLREAIDERLKSMLGGST
ncbi:MAG: hypothetical protein CMH58_01020 [Myxococcales bacterium]|nr:hypothetical protein [Myxococcales bacterium]